MLRFAGICRRVSSSVVSPVTKTVVRSAVVVATLAAVCLPASGQTAAQFANSLRYISSTWLTPTAVAMDASGNLFVTSIGDNTVREVYAATNYTTSAQIAVANGDFSGPYGIAVDASANVFVTDTQHHVVKEILAAGGYVTVNTLASSGLYFPFGIGVNAAGDVYVGDYGGTSPVHVISAASGYASISAAPLPAGGVLWAGGITFDAAGNMFLTDTANNAVYESPIAGGYTTLTQLGAANGNFDVPRQIAVDANGNVYVADTINFALKEIVAAGGYTTVNTLYSDTNEDYGVVLNAKGDIFFTDKSHNIYEIEKSGVDLGSVNVGANKTQRLTFAITGGGAIDTAPSVLTTGVTGGTFTDAGTGTCTTNGTSHTYVVGESCTVDVKFSPLYPGVTHGAVVLTSGGATIATALLNAMGVGPLAAFTLPTVSGYQSGLNRPRDIVFDGNGNFYVADNGDSAVYKYPAGGGSRVSIGSGWGNPTGLAIDGVGNLYVADFYNGLFKVTPDGVKTAIGVHQVQPSGVAVDGSGNVYWVNGAGDRDLYKLSPDGTETKLGDFYNSAGQIAVDSTGNIYVAQGFNVWKVPPTGTVGNGTLIFHEPIGAFAASVDVDPAGNVYVSENDHNIYEVPEDGSAAYITLDTGYTTTGIRWWNGDVYVTDGSNRQIRRLARNSTSPLAFPSTPVNGTSSPKIVAMENDGNSDLHLTVPATGVNPTIPAGFTVISTCPPVAAGGVAYAVAPGHTCADTISFAPVATNTAYAGTLVHTSDSGNVTTASSVVLSGTSTGTLTSTTLGVAPANTIVVGSGGVTLTASVSPITATGTVTFYDGTNAISTAITPTAGVATFAYTNPAAGSHSLTAVFTGTTGFNNSTSAIQTLAVNQLTQSIVFAQPPAQVGGSTYALPGYATSGLPVAYTIVSGPAILSGSLLTYTGHGSVVISANQAGNGTYSAAATVTYSVAVSAPAVAYAYGAASVLSTGSPQTAYVTFATGGTLDSITTYNQRAAVSDFQVVSGGTCVIGTTYTAGQDCSINYTFAPSAVGTRLGGLVLATNVGPQQLAISYISGVGLAPIFTFVNPTGSVFATGTTQPSSMSIDADGILYIGSGISNNLSEFTSTGLGIVDSFPMPPAGVAVDGASNFAYVQGNQIIKSSPSNVTIMTYPTNGYAVTPAGIAFGTDGTLYAADPTHHSIVYFALDGTAFALNTGGVSFTASSVAIDAANHVYISDQANNRILKVPAYGGTATAVAIIGAVPTSVQSVAIDPAGDLYIAQSAGPVLRVTPDGVAVALSLDGLTPAFANDAAGITVDGKGRVFVVSASTGAVYMFDPNLTAQLTFPKTVVGTSSVQTVEPVLNAGTANLVFGGMTPSIDWNFGGAGTTCSTVAPGATCGLGIVFAPTVTGTLIETVSVADNSLNTTASQSIPVTGEGLNNPTLQLSPTNINFASTTVNTAAPTYSVNFSNLSGVPAKFKLPYVAITGPDAAQFSQTNNCGTDLAAYSSCQIVITFRPLVAGNFNAALTLTDYTVSYIQTTTLSGTGVNVTTLLAPSSLNFSDQTVGSSSASQSIIFSNTSPGVVNVSNVAITGADAANFAQSNNCLPSLQPNANCVINVVFKPGAVGSFTNAAIQITDDVPGSPQVAPLSGNGIAPVVTLSASTLNFGSVAQSISSPSQTVNFSNTSSVPVMIVGITPGGGDSAQFSFDRSDCGATLAAFSTCKIVVTFSPTAPGNFNGSFVVGYSSNGTPQATQTVALTGTGLAPTIAISATSLAFTNQEVGTNSSTQVVTLSNNGGGPVTIGGISLPAGAFTQNNNCPISPSKLAQGANCAITVTFNPPAVTSYTGTITIADDAGGPQTVALTGTGTNPIVTLSASNIDFSNQPINTTSNTQSVTFNNTSGVDVTIAVGLSGATSSFVLGGTCGTTLPKFSTCTIVVSFKPSAPGAVSAVVTATVNGSNPQTIALTGTGVAPTISVSATSLTFDSTVPNTTSTAQIVTISNTGGGPVQLGTISIAGAGFADTTNCGAVLAQGANCTVSVTFTPTAPSTYAGMLTIPDNAAGGPHSVALSGTSALPVISLSQTSIDYGTQTVGTASNSQTITVNNQSGSTVALATPAIVGAGFTLNNGCGTQIGAHSTCTLIVAFAPTAAIAYTATLTVVDAGAGSPHLVTLTGTGAAVTALLAPNGITFGHATVGDVNTTQSFTLQNTSQGVLTIGPIGFTGSNGSAFTQTNNCGTSLPANASCLINVGYTPVAAGTFSAMLVVNDNASGGSQTASVSAVATLPSVQVSASNIDFGTQAVGTTSSTPYTVNFSNNSGVIVPITKIVVGGTYLSDFAVSNTCGGSVQPHASCTILVTFTPAAVATYTATLSVISAGGTQTIALTGTGVVAPDYSLVASNPALSLLAGQTGVVSFKLTPTGGYKGSVTLSLSGLGSGITAAFVPATLVADGSNSVQTSVLTIHTDGPNTGTVSEVRGSSTKTALASMMFLPALLLGGLLVWRRRKLSVSGQRLLTLLILASFVSGLAGCASPLTLTPGTQTVTVTAVSQATGTGGAAVTHTAVFTLTVKNQ
jgi:sugar lactone lactonase YvrE